MAWLIYHTKLERTISSWETEQEAQQALRAKLKNADANSEFNLIVKRDIDTFLKGE